MAESALKDLFLHPDEHLLFKGLTKLLADLDAHFAREKGGSGDYLLHLTSSEKKGVHRNLYEFLQQTHVNLLVRDHEILALIIGGTVPGKPEEGSITVLNNPQVVIAANPREIVVKSRHREQEKGESRWKGVTVRAAEKLPLSDAEKDDPIALVLGKNCQEGKLEVTFPFHQHVGNYIQLLKDCHEADKASLDSAVKRLTQYIYITSYPKMIRRLYLRSKDNKMSKNFFEILRCLPHEIPQEHHDLEVPPEFAGVRPTEKQQEFFEDFWKRTQPRLDAPKLAKSKFYNKAGRRRFQEVLAVTLDEAKESLTDLQDAMDETRRDKKSDSAQRNKIERLVNNAHEVVRELLCLLDLFDGILIPHLKWLARISGIERGKDLPIWSDDPPLPEKGDLPGPPDEKSAATVSDNQTGEEEEDEEDADKAGDDDDDISELDKLEIGGGGWPAAAKKYLHLICLHQSSLLRATDIYPGSQKAHRQREKSQVLNSNVTIVDVIPEMSYRARWSIKKVLETLQKERSELDVEKLTDWLNAKLSNEQRSDGEKSYMTKTTTGGTIHAEAILMSLIAIAFDEQAMEQIPPEGLQSDDIFVEKDSLLSMIKGTLPLMDVSKRCCPPCWTIVETLSDKRLVDAQAPVVAPGYHAKWSASALPSFMPRVLAGPCLNRAKEEAIERLLKIQQKLAEEERVKQNTSDATEVGTAYRPEQGKGHKGWTGARSQYRPQPNEVYEVSDSSDGGDDGDGGDIAEEASSGESAQGASASDLGHSNPAVNPTPLPPPTREAGQSPERSRKLGEDDTAGGDSKRAKKKEEEEEEKEEEN